MEYIKGEHADFPYQLNKIPRVLQLVVAGKGFFAGGMFKNLFTDTPARDLDIWAPTEDALNQIALELGDLKCSKEGYEAQLHYKTDKARGYTLVDSNEKPVCKFELVNSRSGGPKQVLDEFDFSITKFAYVPVQAKDGNKEQVGVLGNGKCYYHPTFFRDLVLKRLVLENPNKERPLDSPINTWNRALKYTRYGYNLCRESKKYLLRQVHSQMEDFEKVTGLAADIRRSDPTQPSDLTELLDFGIVDSLYAGKD